MANIVLIPTSAEPYSSQFTSLDGQDYLLQFAYNQREDCWYLSISDSESNSLAEGRKLVCLWPLLLGVTDPRLPKGVLMVLSNTTDVSTPGLADLAPGARCVLAYEPVG